MAILLHHWTVEDYHRIVEAGILSESDCELLQGNIVDMPPEGPEHAHRCETTARYLERLLGDGWWSRQGKPISLIDSEPQPDIALVREADYSDRHPSAEDVYLIVEYARTTQKQDKGIKREIYAEAKIAHYLVVDLKEGCVIYYTNPMNRNYMKEQIFHTGIIQVGTISIDVLKLLRS
ncbi:Uma2 family endonuclease [Oscillatoria sp. FACHB-1407]|uniref:Uma2 family endonuclease n=1 Tax=Oscillatoria sp. FACHB-1407 TaxID=2692847 RepID=UPI001684460A|nr:Uma2 family endonuclease [Oscillatoria sp. FACHB-1407]MBD2463040.1 Uma2 family endonuclease [Oscillatoria sp. FACHB-1407]